MGENGIEKTYRDKNLRIAFFLSHALGLSFFAEISSQFIEVKDSEGRLKCFNQKEKR